MSGTRQTMPVERKFTGRHMLIVMLAFFGTIIAVNLTMAVLASRTWTGLVVKNSYVASQHYNEVLAEANRQAALGWQGQIAYDGERLRFALSDRDGRPVHVLDPRVRMSRPTHEHDDQALDLGPTAAGYEAEAKLGAGIWNADVSARGDDGLSYRAHFRLVVKAGG